jgi:hypothetical protein
VNKKVVLPVLITISLVIVGIVGWQLYSNQNIPDRQATIIANTPIPTESPEQNDFTASFEIYTNGTKRIFTDVKYRNQSQNVFIQNPDPSTIYVKTAGTTWADFFETLPFSLSKECLVTGTGQTFCSNENQRLRFFLNDIENPQVLDLQINPGDNLQVTYGN